MRSQSQVSGERAGGRRLLVQSLRVLSLSALLASCTPLRIGFPIQQAEADWATDGRTSRRDRVSMDDPVVLPIEQAWIYNAGAGFSAGSPLIVAEHVFVATRKGEIHVVDLTTGAKIGTKEFGHSIEGVPAFSNQILYVPNAWGKTAITAFDVNLGTTLWEYRGVPVEGSVLLVGGLAIVGDVEGNVIALEQGTGVIRWVYELGSVATIFSGPVSAGSDKLVVANELGEVACLRTTDGEEVWVRSLDSPVESSIASDHNHVYIPTTRGMFFALNLDDGSTNWEYRSPNGEVRFTAAAVSAEHIMFGGSDGVLRALRPENGSTEWTFQTDGAFAGPPAISGQLVFVGAMDRSLFALGKLDGSVQWTTTLRGRIKSGPGVTNGFVIVMSEPSYVYGFANVETVAAL